MPSVFIYNHKFLEEVWLRRPVNFEFLSVLKIGRIPKKCLCRFGFARARNLRQVSSTRHRTASDGAKNLNWDWTNFQNALVRCVPMYANVCCQFKCVKELFAVTSIAVKDWNLLPIVIPWVNIITAKSRIMTFKSNFFILKMYR